MRELLEPGGTSAVLQSALAGEIAAGTLTRERPGCYAHELPFGSALPRARAALRDEPELFGAIPSRQRIGNPEDEDYFVGDADRADAVDDWDDRARFEDWEVPLMQGHPRLTALLFGRHPYTWFDNAE